MLLIRLKMQNILSYLLRIQLLWIQIMRSFWIDLSTIFIFLFFQIFSNGPSMSPESPQDMHKSFIQEIRQPMLRQGYIPISVSHENTEPRLQQYPSFSYIHPAVQQSLRTDGRTPSPTPASHCRPRSPVQAPSEACLSCSPASHGPEVRPLGVRYLY